MIHVQAQIIPNHFYHLPKKAFDAPYGPYVRRDEV